MTTKDKKIIEDSEAQGIPIFVLTAKDILSTIALKSYYEACDRNGCKEKHLNGILRRIEDFNQWQSGNINKTKIPD